MEGKRSQMEKHGRMEHCTIPPNPCHVASSRTLDTCTRSTVAHAYALRAMHGTRRTKGRRASSRMLDTCARGIVARACALRAMHGTQRTKGKRASSRMLDTCARGIVARACALRTMHGTRQTKGDRAPLCTRYRSLQKNCVRSGVGVG